MDSWTFFSKLWGERSRNCYFYDFFLKYLFLFLDFWGYIWVQNDFWFCWWFRREKNWRISKKVKFSKKVKIFWHVFQTFLNAELSAEFKNRRKSNFESSLWGWNENENFRKNWKFSKKWKLKKKIQKCENFRKKWRCFQLHLKIVEKVIFEASLYRDILEKHLCGCDIVF